MPIDETALHFDRAKIHEALNEPQRDAYYVVATQGYPKFAGELSSSPFHAYDDTLAPTWGLMNKYDSMERRDWHERFAAQAGHDYIASRALDHAEDAGDKRVVFLCYEDDDEDCHTWTLLDVLREAFPEATIMDRPDGHPDLTETDGGPATHDTSLDDWL